MRLILVTLILTFLVSCGKDEKNNPLRTPQNERRHNSEGNSAENIYDGLGIDIVETAVDVQATVSLEEITFKETKSMKNNGRRINCISSVNKGDIYRYSVKGDTLYLSTPVGNIDMKRVYGQGGIVGTWKWMGLVEGAALETRLLTITKSMNRVIMRNICER